MRKLRIFFYFILLSFRLYAIAPDSAKNSGRQKVQVRFIPVISYAPETQFLGGAGCMATFQLCHPDSVTHHSLVAAFVAYTQNKQDYIYVPYQLYTKNNNFYFEGELDYYNFSYYYWGIGNERVPQELYNVRFPRIFVNAYRKIYSHFYAGIDYYYENDNIWGTSPVGVLQYGEIPGSAGSVNSGAGIDALYDSRDSIYFPKKGLYVKFNSYFNNTALGSTYMYDKIIGNIAWYKSLSRRIVLALNEYTQLTSGNAPFNQLALVGGRYQMRGYYTGYYRDDDLTLMQAELRVHLIGRFALAAFGSAAAIGNAHIFPESPFPIVAEGIGLRYNYNVKHHINIRGDMGFGNTIEYYLTIQEAF